MSLQLELPFFDSEGFLAWRLRQRLHGRVNDYHSLAIRPARIRENDVWYPEFRRKGQFWISCWRQLCLPFGRQ